MARLGHHLDRCGRASPHDCANNWRTTTLTCDWPQSSGWGGIGELDDIALLSDLLLLDEADDEHPLERAALADAMLRISQRTSE